VEGAKFLKIFMSGWTKQLQLTAKQMNNILVMVIAVHVCISDGTRRSKGCSFMLLMPDSLEWERNSQRLCFPGARRSSRTSLKDGGMCPCVSLPKYFIVGLSVGKRYGKYRSFQ